MAQKRHRLAQRRKAVGLSQEQLAEVVGVDRSTVVRWERADNEPQPWHRPRLAKALRISIDELAGLLATVDVSPSTGVHGQPDGQHVAYTQPTESVGSDLSRDEIDALELARRIAASDLSNETLDRLEGAVDELATAYTTTPPDLLLPRVRLHLGYVGQLVDVRKTLGQQRRLLVAGGWLALLGATIHIDLHQRPAAASHLATARHMAEHADHTEIIAWCLETRAWEVLTAGDYTTALALSQQAQAIAPRGSSALIQATAQEGRALARMGQATETRNALSRTARLVAPLPVPDRPEHHYRYDPGKATAYTATTLSWIGDPAAEDYARVVVEHMETDAIARPRRLASARLDLALALLVARKPDEASAAALSAIASGRVVPSNWWRVSEVMTGVEDAGICEASDLRDAYEAFNPVR